MSFSNINRKVIEPSIVANRLSKRSTENVWNYITNINKQLTNNIIQVDGSIIITGYFIVDSNIITQITDLYESAGWIISNVTFTNAVGNDPGKTEMTFTPPA